MSAATNPFRSECVTALPFRPQNAAWEEMLRELESLGWRGAVVGPCGSGKTTLLERLAPELANRGFEPHFHRLDSSQRRLQAPFWNYVWSPNDALLLDGAEQLPLWKWQRLKWHARGAGAFILTSHRAGLLPTWVRSSTSPALLERLCRELEVELSPSESQAIFETYRGDIRLCLLELYHRAGKGALTPVWESGILFPCR